MNRTSHVPSLRVLSRLTVLLTICALFSLLIKGLDAAKTRISVPSPTYSSLGRPKLASAANPAIAVQTQETLLKLPFTNGSLTGIGGQADDQPSTALNVTFQPSLVGEGAILDRISRLAYPSQGNINATEGTVELWLKPTWLGTDSQTRTIFRYGNVGGIFLGKEGNNLRLAMNRGNNNGSLEIEISANIQNWQISEWHHIAAVWSNNEKVLRLYLDGTLVADRALGTQLPTIDNTANSTLQIGGEGGRSSLQATIDDFTISNYAISSREIANRMQTGLTFTVESATNRNITLYPGWSYWQDLRFTALATVGTTPTSTTPLSLPFLAATISAPDKTIADVDEVTGRIKATGVSTASTTITGTLRGVLMSIAVNVISPPRSPLVELVAPELGTPMSGAKYEIPVAVIRYIPLTGPGNNVVNTSLTGINIPVEADLRERQKGIEKKLKFMLEEGSRFRGYKNTNAPSLGYKVVKIINVYEEIPPGLPATNPNEFFPDYKQIFGRADINAKELIESQKIKEIWLEQYVTPTADPLLRPTIALNESNLASPISNDISSSLRTSHDLPIYGSSYTVFGFSYLDTEVQAARAHGHHIEALLTFANIRQDGNDNLFQESFIGRDGSRAFLPGRCGKTDRPPNSTGDFNFDNPAPILSDIEDWTPEGGLTKQINSAIWKARHTSYTVEGQWYIYWMQAIPGEGNLITRFGTENLTNWWRFVGDWDGAITERYGLTEVSCQYLLSSAELIVPTSGGSGVVIVSTSPTCAWKAERNNASDTWITLSPNNSNVVGSGSVSLTIAAGTSARSGTVTIAGQPFTVRQIVNNPTPNLSSIDPATVVAGSAAFTLTLTGSDFLPNSTVLVNGVTRTATLVPNVNSTKLTVGITTGDIANAGSLIVTVVNPTPGGGTSANRTLNITAPCNYSLTPTSQNFTAAGGSSSVAVNTGTGCAWSVNLSSKPAWITINSGQESGTGNGAVGFTVASNSGNTRSGTLTIQGQTFTVTQDAAQVACLAQRTLPAEYIVASPLPVSLQVSPPANTQSYAVEETPPVGWTVTAIDNNGTYDAANNKVKWGPFFDASALTLKYAATPPTGTVGPKTFSGTVSSNGTSNTTCGTSTTDAASPMHPADLSNNLRLEINELTSYGAAWKSGAAWSRPPNPIDINYVTNAGLIWKLGEVYRYDPSKTPPYTSGASVSNVHERWFGGSPTEILTQEAARKMLQAMAYMPGVGFSMRAALPTILETAFGGTAVSSFSVVNYTPGVGVTVTISITPDAGTQVYAVEDTTPIGWTVTNINNSGAYDTNNRKVKWGPFFDNSPRTLNYVITPPSGETSNQTFVGTVSFDGVSVAVAGSRTIALAPSCSYSLSSTSQGFNANGGSGSFNVLAQTGCSWSASTSDGWLSITQGSGTGNGAVNFSVAPNAGASRTGIISVGGQTFTVNQPANNAPTISPANALTRQQGATATTATIATVGDTETATNSLIVAATSIPTGLSITDVTNTNGTVSAIVTASCSAAPGTNTVALRVTDAQGAVANANLSINVTANPNCFLPTTDTSGSDQRIGSVLLYSYYESDPGNTSAENTQIRLTNTNESQETAVRLFFIDAQTSSVYSLFVCLPPNQTISYLMSELDPFVTGYIIAVAVNKTTGCPINFNFLTGGASIKLASGHSANLGAMAIAAVAVNPTACVTGNVTTTINFDGTNYGRLPRLLIVDNLASLRDGPSPRLIVNRIGGSLVGKVGGIGTIVGRIYNASRTAQDFSFSSSLAQSANNLTTNFPRLLTRLDSFIPAGQSGWMKFWTDANWGIFGSVMNASSNLRTPNAFGGGYNLPQGALANAVSLEIPISVPNCQ